MSAVRGNGPATGEACAPAGPISSRAPRRDAARNRERLVEAALTTFLTDGLEAPLDTIARRAGLGNATLYRHFPTREDLLEAVFVSIREDVTRTLSHYEVVADGHAAIGEFFAEMWTRVPLSSPLGRLTDAHLDSSPALRGVFEDCTATLNRLLTVGQAQGTIRADVDFADLMLLLSNVRPIILAADDQDPRVWHRHIALALDALRPSAYSPLPPIDGVDHEQVRLDIAFTVASGPGPGSPTTRPGREPHPERH